MSAMKLLAALVIAISAMVFVPEIISEVIGTETNLSIDDTMVLALSFLTFVMILLYAVIQGVSDSV